MTAIGAQIVNDMLQEENLGRTGFIIKAGLCFFALLAAKGWIGENVIKEGGLS
ncbi:MAG: hypothetical protein R2867_47300 [Caldilineaceae bacterium]